MYIKSIVRLLAVVVVTFHVSTVGAASFGQKVLSYSQDPELANLDAGGNVYDDIVINSGDEGMIGDIWGVG